MSMNPKKYAMKVWYYPQRLAASQGANADAWNNISDVKHSVH